MGGAAGRPGAAGAGCRAVLLAIRLGEGKVCVRVLERMRVRVHVRARCCYA